MRAYAREIPQTTALEGTMKTIALCFAIVILLLIAAGVWLFWTDAPDHEPDDADVP